MVSLNVGPLGVLRAEGRDGGALVRASWSMEDPLGGGVSGRMPGQFTQVARGAAGRQFPVQGLAHRRAPQALGVGPQAQALSVCRRRWVCAAGVGYGGRGEGQAGRNPPRRGGTADPGVSVWRGETGWNRDVLEAGQPRGRVERKRAGPAAERSAEERLIGECPTGEWPVANSSDAKKLPDECVVRERPVEECPAAKSPAG